MSKVLIYVTAMLAVAFMLVSCSNEPLKREDLDPETLKNIIYDTEGSRLFEAEAENAAHEEQHETEPGEAEIIEEAQEPEEIDTHVYTGEELTDEILKKKLIGYWETGDFGYLIGYQFFESGFLQLVMQRKVNQTGIYMVGYSGVYFSLDSKNWDDDIFFIESISHDEIVGKFDDNILVLHRTDPSLVEENSGDGLINNQHGTNIVDAATEVKQNVKVN